MVVQQILILLLRIVGITLIKKKEDVYVSVLLRRNHEIKIEREILKVGISIFKLLVLKTSIF